MRNYCKHFHIRVQSFHLCQRSPIRYPTLPSSLLSSSAMSQQHYPINDVIKNASHEQREEYGKAWKAMLLKRDGASASGTNPYSKSASGTSRDTYGLEDDFQRMNLQNETSRSRRRGDVKVEDRSGDRYGNWRNDRPIDTRSSRLEETRAERHERKRRETEYDRANDRNYENRNSSGRARQPSPRRERVSGGRDEDEWKGRRGDQPQREKRSRRRDEEKYMEYHKSTRYN